ncbi:MAG: hypothetical protein KGD60_13050 [Candidatus Thorarchaeota archaeon]|nr:hypothetical protein [Candidatus Thorarchaeota archaeon]
MLRLLKERIFHIVLLLWILNAATRIVFGVMTITEGSLLDVAVPLAVEQTLTVMFLTLGVLGFIAVPGLAMQKDWGVQMTVAVSLATIGFDVWALTIQFTAALGFIVPAVMLVYLAMRQSRKDLMAPMEGPVTGANSE